MLLQSSKLLFEETTLVHGVEEENDLATNDPGPIEPKRGILHRSILRGASHWDLWT